jgi:hypothetical protein
MCGSKYHRGLRSHRVLTIIRGNPALVSQLLQRRRKSLHDRRRVVSATVASTSAFDADIGTDSAHEIREYFIPDFSNWKDHDSYQTAFQRLVKDLKAGAGG